MFKIFKVIIFLVIGVNFLLPSNTIQIDDFSDHLKGFKEFNSQVHHDNIDDNVDVHAHKHKHSKDGDEHEHKHEHTKISNTDSLKIIPDLLISNYLKPSLKGRTSFSVKSLFSNAHPSDFFRPPIS